MTLKEVILNHKIFIFFICFFSLVVIGALIYGQTSCSKQLSAQEIVDHPITRRPPQMPLEINVVDSDFSKQDINTLKYVADTWKKESNGVVSINFNFGWIPPRDFDRFYYLDYLGKKTLWKRGGNNLEILKLQTETSITADGVSKGDYIVIMDNFNDVSQKKLFIIAMHEIGHQLGGEHINNQYPALMNIGGNNGEITKYDLIMLCYLYECK